MKPKAPRNKTLDISFADGQAYFANCLTAKNKLTADNLINKTICGDTLKICTRLPRQFVDLLIVDPPYNLSKDFNGHKFAATSDEAYAAYTAAWLEKMLPLLKPTASIYVCCDWKSSLTIGPLLKKYFHVQNRITWQREKGRGAQKNWKNGMEDIWFAVKNPNEYYFNLEAVKMRRFVRAPYKENGQPKDWVKTSNGNFRDTCPSNFWDDISIPFWSMSENTPHPTQKPEKLYAKLILASSKEGDMIFDPFLGSGTASVVAKKLKRNYCGIELDEQYAILAEKRLMSAEQNSSIQGYTDGVFWERNTLLEQKFGSKKTDL